MKMKMKEKLKILEKNLIDATDYRNIGRSYFVCRSELEAASLMATMVFEVPSPTSLTIFRK